MICPVCDREVQEGNNFCLYCGSPLVSASAQNSLAQQPPQMNQTPQQPQMDQSPQQQMNMAPPQVPPQKPENSNKPLLIAIICLLALLIVGLFALIIVLNKNNNSGNNTSVVKDKDDDDEDKNDDDDEKKTTEKVEEKASSDSDKEISGKESEKETEDQAEEESHIYPDDATKYSGHHYKVYYESMTWQEAENFCVSQGGHLISINSSTEQDFAVTLSQGDDSRYNVWTGGHLGDNGTWEWTDGSSFAYSNWDIAYYNDDGSYVLKPDNYTGTEFVIRFPNRTVEFEDWTTYEGKWDDSMNDPDLGTDTFCFICEWSE